MEVAKSNKVNKLDIHSRANIRQSEEYGRYMRSLGWKVVWLNSEDNPIQVFIKDVSIFGAVAKIQRYHSPLPINLLDTLLKENRVIMCKLEPDESFNKEDWEELRRYGFRIDSWSLTGTKTSLVSLKLSEESIFDSFMKDSRYCIRKAKNQKNEIFLDRFDRFYDIWKVAARNKNLWIPSEKDLLCLKKEFGNNCYCIMVDDMAGCVVLIHDKEAHYYYSAALPEAKIRNLPYLVVWEAMKEAKIRGCEVWDFEGLFDERWPNNGWRGFTHFKKSFGGSEVDYFGCLVKWSLKNVIYSLKH